MTDWLHTQMGQYDRLGLLLTRLGASLFGVWLAQGLPAVPFPFKTLLLLLGLTLVFFAERRAKSGSSLTESGAGRLNC